MAPILRTLPWSVLLLCAVLAATACGDDEDNGSSGASPRRGGTITIQYVEFESFDPHFSAFTQDIGLQRMVWRGLYRLGADNLPKPDMAAAAPTISPDGTTYTVRLRSGLSWSDGQPLTANDFALGILRTCDPDNAGQYQATLSSVAGCDAYYRANGNPNASPPVPAKSAAEKAQLRDAVGVRATDDTTLEIRLAAPQASFTTILALWMTFPVPSHIVKTPGEAWPEPTRLAFNGPFKVKSYSPRDRIELERNDRFAGEQALLDGITLRFIDQMDVAENAYRAGQLHMTGANVANLDAIRNDATLSKEYLQTAIPVTRALFLNLSRTPLDNYKLRLALSRATDRETLNRVVFSGTYKPSTTWIPPSVAGGGLREDAFAAEIGYNPAEAKKALAEAGFPEGRGLRPLVMPIADNPFLRATAEFLKEQWKQVLGVEVDVRIVDGRARGMMFATGDYDVYPSAFSQDYPDPESWVLGLFTTGAPNNRFGCSDPRIDDLAKNATTNRNDEERRSQWREVNRLISVDPMCSGPVLFQESLNYLVKPSVRGARESSNQNDAMIAGDWNVEAWWLAQ